MITFDEIVKRADELHERSKQLVAEAVQERRSSRRSATVPLSIQRSSANRKLAPQDLVTVPGSGRIRFEPRAPFCTSTYVSIAATCPTTCRWHPSRDGGCYAASGMAHLGLGRLDAAAREWSPLETTRAEAEAIGRLWRAGIPQDGAAGGRDLRLHVSGEASCADGVVLLAGAAAGWRARGGGAVWTYSHRWAEIPREAWGSIEVFASVDDPTELRAAVGRGYRPAVVVPRLDRASFDLGNGIRALACPYEAGGDVTCVECRWCLEPHEERRAVAFQPHGRDRAQVRLRVIQGGAS